jgi:uncharacterized membrane protein
MMNLKNLLTTPFLSRLSKPALVFLFVVSGLGFLDAAYLTVEHYVNKIPPCSIGSCEAVLTSSYATVAGIPVALGGTIYYFAFLVLLLLYVDLKKEKYLRIALASSVFGFGASIYFFILQAFVLHAFCLYCMGSALTSTTLFVTAIVIFKRYRGVGINSEQ